MLSTRLHMCSIHALTLSSMKPAALRPADQQAALDDVHGTSKS